MDKLPIDIIREEIIPYTYTPQPKELCKDIRSFYNIRDYLCKLYYDRWFHTFHYEENADLNWLDNDICRFFNDDIATNLYDQNNSGLESTQFPNTTYTDLRLGPLKFDRNGLLWSMTCFVARPLKSYNPSSGQWQSYSFEEIIPNPIGDELGFSDLEIDTNGTKWTGSFFNGLIGFNENGNRVKRLYTQDQNMPSKSVKSLAIDNRNQLWIGTESGLRVLYNTSNFFDEPNVQASEIVILDDGIPKELLSDQFISDIKVDGSNQFIDCIVTTDTGKRLATIQASHQFKLYTDLEFPLC